MTGILNMLTAPMDAGPRDRFVGRDDAGNMVYETILGQTYVVKPQASAADTRRREVGKGLLAAAQAGEPFEPMLAGRDSPTLGQAATGLLGSMVEGITAPGRAARGEPVTLGDAWSTALDFGVMSPLGKAPAGAIRSGASRTDDGMRALAPAERTAQEVLDMLRQGRASEVTDEMMAAADPQHLFRNYDLPMDEASRTGRAREMGFDTDTPLYHGTAEDFPAFSESSRGGVTGARSARDATWFADNPNVADTYARYASDQSVQDLIDRSYRAEVDGDWPLAERLMREAEELEARGTEGANIIDAMGPRNVRRFDMGGAQYNPDDTILSDYVAQAKQSGHQGLELNEFVDNAYYGDTTPGNHRGIFNPTNIRSRFARFDPRLSHLRNLSAGGAGLAALLGVSEAELEEMLNGT